MFLGLDLGTSGVRALLVTDSGVPLDSADAALSAAHPHAGWSEQDPADWIAAARQAIGALRDRAPDRMAGLRGIGLSGQMHGAVVLDAGNAVLRPCILWNDGRSSAQAAQLDAEGAFREISGNIVFPGFTAPKLAWLAENEPGTFARVATVLLPKDYLVFWLTGRLVSEMSDASGTAWLDTGGRHWSDPLLKRTGMRRDQLPDLLEGTGVVGPLLGELARELGLPEGVPVVAGGADNAAAACGAGALAPGDGFVSLGTSGVVLVASDGFHPAPSSAVHSFCHAVPGTWYQMGVMLAATDSLNWLARVAGADAADLTAELGDRAAAPGPPRFLPYLSGERTPHNDMSIRGAFVGLDISHTRADLTRAVLEGVSFGLRDSLDALKSSGAAPDRLLAIGGGTGSRYWVELLATVLGLPLDLPRGGEFGAALGAARLAICGVTGTDPMQVMTRPEIAETIDPRPDLRRAAEDAHADFTASFPTLKAMP